MKKSLLIAVLSVLSLGARAAVVPHGQLWSSVTTSDLSVDRAILGVSADLGSPKYGAVLDLDALKGGLQTASVHGKDLLSKGDKLSLGLQATAFEGYLDSKLGQMPYRCYGCVNQKSLSYSAALAGASVVAQVREGEALSLLASRSVEALGAEVAAAVEYSDKTKKYQGKGAILKKVGPVDAALVLHVAEELDYNLSATAQVHKMLGVYGEVGKGGKYRLGPTVTVSDSLQLAALYHQDGKGADQHVDVHVAAQF